MTFENKIRICCLVILDFSLQLNMACLEAKKKKKKISPVLSAGGTSRATQDVR